MNGAEAMIRGLVSAGVDTCFANPGTSEMHMVQAIDGIPEMRGILCLFEGVCTGAADGYARMQGTPAATLLHLGAGLGNSIANLHNARRASTPLINLVGDHAGYHSHLDAPLTSDIDVIARGVSAWIRSVASSEGLGQDARDAVAASLAPLPQGEGNVATLIVPADCAWGEGRAVSGPVLERQLNEVTEAGIAATVEALNVGGASTMLLLDGNGLSEDGVFQAGRIAATTGCRVYSTTFPARVESGPDQYSVLRMPYFPEQVIETMSSVECLILAGANAPVSFFAYPTTPSELTPETCKQVTLAARHQDVAEGLRRVADALGAAKNLDVGRSRQRPALPTGQLDTRGVAMALAALMPDEAIVAVDSGGGGAAYPVLQQAVRHTWLNLTGGAIGQGGPVAVGAAVACPSRPVFALLGDGGSGLYGAISLDGCARKTEHCNGHLFESYL